MTRVAVVHDWLTGMRGGEKVLDEILALVPRPEIYTLFHFPGAVNARIESHPIHTSFLQRLPGARRHYRSYLPLFPAAIESFDLNGFDLVVSTSHCVAKGCVPPPGAVHVCYCHTPMRYAWDQEHAYFPRRTGIVARLRGAALSRLRTWDVASAPRVDRFLANSSFVAERIRRYYGRQAEVVHPPVDTEFFTPDDSAGEPSSAPFCLAVSALAPYKRMDWAIAACERSGIELRIVGEGPERERLRGLAGGRTRFLGRVEGPALRELYREALCFLQPGIEDFGIAAVEALACGTPVVALGRGGVRDIVRDGRDGALVDEEGPDNLVHILDKIRKVEFNRLDLRHRAEEFSANAFRQRMQNILNPLLERPAQ